VSHEIFNPNTFLHFFNISQSVVTAVRSCLVLFCHVLSPCCCLLNCSYLYIFHIFLYLLNVAIFFRIEVFRHICNWKLQNCIYWLFPVSLSASKNSSITEQIFIKFCILKKQSSPATRHGGAWGERRYSSYLFLSSALDRGEWSASRPGRALPRG